MSLDPKKFEIPSRTTYKLEGVRRVSSLLGHPELGRKTILVTGTNGKGSTCAFLTSLFKAAGYKVGTYSSPHVAEPEERIRLQGKPIEKSRLRKIEKELEKKTASLTFFERWTILAFEVFKRQKVDIQIIEVGIGGRLDATNICDPDVSLIATIDEDHKDVLGPTLHHIAREKIGIMRSQRPLICQTPIPSVKTLMKDEARREGAEIRFLKRGEFSLTLEKMFKTVADDLGEHQEWNARLAFSAFSWILKKEKKNLPALSILKSCFKSTSLWPARFQILSKKPIVILEGGHNRQALEGFVKRLRRLYPGKKFGVVFGMMSDKAAREAIQRLKPITKIVYLPVFYPERQISTMDLEGLWRSLGVKDVVAFGSTESALDAFWRKSNRPVDDFLIVGSFYLAGDVLRCLARRKEKLWEPRA